MQDRFRLQTEVTKGCPCDFPLCVLQALETLDNGKPYAISYLVDLDMVVKCLRWVWRPQLELNLCRFSYLQIQVLWDLDLTDGFIPDTLGLLFYVISLTSQSQRNDGDLLQHRNCNGRHKYFYSLSIL